MKRATDLQVEEVSLRVLAYMLETYRCFRYRRRGLAPADYTTLHHHPSRESARLIYLAAVSVAVNETYEAWTKCVTGRRGRPENVPPYIPDIVAGIYVEPYLAHSFRLWLDRQLGHERDSGRWAYASEEPYTVSLDEIIGIEKNNADDEGDGRSLTRLDSMTSQSLVAIDPATLLLFKYPELRPIYDLFPWNPSMHSPQSGRPLLEKDRDAIKTKIRRGGLGPLGSITSIDEKSLGSRWLKANPLLTWSELRVIRRDIRQMVRGDYIPDLKPLGHYPRVHVGDVEEASLRWEYELPVQFKRWRLERRGRHVRLMQDGDVSISPFRVRGRIRSYRQPETAHAEKLRLENEPARISKVGARCPTCRAFVTSQQALQHHDCVYYLANRKGLSLSTAALELIRTAVRAENQPILDKLEELIELTIARLGHPADEAERILDEAA